MPNTQLSNNPYNPKKNKTKHQIQPEIKHTRQGYFIANSVPDKGLGPGGAGARFGRGANSVLLLLLGVADGVGIDILPPRLPPRPAMPPPRPCEGEPFVAWLLPCFSFSICWRAALLTRGRRVVLPPRDPGPRKGKPVS